MSDSKKIVPIADTPAKATTFKAVLDEVLHRRNGMSQFQLSLRTNFSQSYISRVERGKRPLTKALADMLALVLGGTKEDWMEIYRAPALEQS